MSSEKHNPLATIATIINGKYYRVEDYPPKEKVDKLGPNAFKKGIAYRYTSDLTKMLFPYHGTVDDPADFSFSTLDVGIWYVKKGYDKYAMRIVRPRTKTEREAYRIGQEKDIVTAVVGREFAPEQFADVTKYAADSGNDIFIPPLHSDDDPLNLLVKAAIITKAAPFEPYGKRLEALAVEKKHGVEGVNIRNNAKRAIKLNNTMSPNKAKQYAETWQLELAFIVRDQPDAMHPMFEDGEMLVIYPSGYPFKIEPDKLIDASNMIQELVADPSSHMPRDEDDET